ncbi:SBBP repeat-containing protein, partial [Priestia megaterium]|uniref:SBBP repeat-containing protein n=1 Tax=Priestia megaterium TaxID=1404 RepID=UPI00366AEE45
GIGSDSGVSIAVDVGCHAYVTGFTNSSDFPVTPGAFDTTFNGDNDAFVTKLNPKGSNLIYSTYLGGTAFDEGRGIAIDSKGNAYITGQTSSLDFPVTPCAFDTTYNGGEIDAFVTKLNPKGSNLIYSTYLGGSGNDQGVSIAVDANGCHAYITGVTNSTNFPTTPCAFDTTLNGSNDAFVTKLNSKGSNLIYSTYLGGTGSDLGIGIAIDAKGNAYITGQTSSLDFPVTPGAFDTTFNGVADAFVTKICTQTSNMCYCDCCRKSRRDLLLRLLFINFKK